MALIVVIKSLLQICRLTDVKLACLVSEQIYVMHISDFIIAISGAGRLTDSLALL